MREQNYGKKDRGNDLAVKWNPNHENKNNEKGRQYIAELTPAGAISGWILSRNAVQAFRKRNIPNVSGTWKFGCGVFVGCHEE